MHDDGLEPLVAAYGLVGSDLTLFMTTGGHAVTRLVSGSASENGTW